MEDSEKREEDWFERQGAAWKISGEPGRYMDVPGDARRTGRDSGDPQEVNRKGYSKRKPFDPKRFLWLVIPSVFLLYSKINKVFKEQVQDWEV
jgi:hypothetical protein